MSLPKLYGEVPETTPNNNIVDPAESNNNDTSEFEDPYSASGSEFESHERRSVLYHNSLTAIGQLGFVVLKQSKRFIETIVMSLLASLGVSTIFGA